MRDMADNKLIGQNYTTPDLVAKVTGKAKYAEDYRVEGMLFAKLLVSPMPHARVKRLDTSAALAMPGVKAILTVDDDPSVSRAVAREFFALPDETKAAFEEYMRNGGGFVCYHAADNAFPDWSDYNLMIGIGGWRLLVSCLPCARR